MEETWTVVGVPTNARITEGISGWERVCDKIIEAKGCIVPDEISGPAAARGRCTERGAVRQSCTSATARTRTCLNSLCTPLSWRPTRASWGPRGRNGGGGALDRF